LYLCFSTSEDKTSGKVEAKVLQTEEIIEINEDWLVAADGCLSSIRKTFLPDLKLRLIEITINFLHFMIMFC
jgi:2-polyprenyl-6-methoxyphenol hydroxylase-like FAD-dependent oxidoreductase